MNNLTQREKILIYAIVGTLPVLGLFFGFNWFMGQLKQKSLELDAVSRQLSDIELRADLAIEKAMLKNQLRQRSLASEENVAQGEYREWLRTLVEDDIEFQGTPKVTSRGNVAYKSDFGSKNVIYTQLSFQLSCQGSYKQIVEFLYRFYERNYIHRITQLNLSLVKGKRVEGKVTYDRNRFNVKADIQVLSLVDADEIRSPIGAENRKLFYQSKREDRLVSSLRDYEQIILRRNLFGFPNNAPDFGSRKKEFDFEEGDRISLRLSADDEDDDDLEFSLVSTDGKVTSDQIEESRSGSFRLDIEKLGSYEFKASVVDKNYYPKTDEMLVVVNIEKKEPEPVRERPQPKPRFDPLKYTYLEAIVRDFAGTPTCWVNVRPFGKMHKVTLGAKFDVGRTEIEIIKINRRDAVISVDGDHYVFQVNDSLGDPQGDRLASSSPRKSRYKDEDDDSTSETSEVKKEDEDSEDDSDKDDSDKDDSSKDDSSKDDASKDDASKDDASKDDASKDDASKDDASKDDSNKDDANKDDASKDDASKDDAIRMTPARKIPRKATRTIPGNRLTRMRPRLRMTLKSNQPKIPEKKIRRVRTSSGHRSPAFAFWQAAQIL